MLGTPEAPPDGDCEFFGWSFIRFLMTACSIVHSLKRVWLLSAKRGARRC